MIKILIGLLIVFFGAGGVENSSDTYELLMSVVISLLGIFLIFVGSKQV